MSNDRSSTLEIKARIGIATSVMTRFTSRQSSDVISFRVKIVVYKSLVSPLADGCDSWTLTA